MTARQILDWLSAHATTAWPIVSALLIVAMRVHSPEEWIALGERSPRVQGAIRLLRAIGLDPVKALAALGQIVTGRAPASAVRLADTVAPRATQPPPAPREGQSGRATVATMLALCVAILVACGVGAVLTGCPRLPPVSGCTAGVYRCTDDGRPEVCASTARWEPIGDSPCAASGAVCVVERTAHCAPHAIVADGGAL